MNSKVQDCICYGCIHNAIGISRRIKYQDFSRDDFIKLIDFCYSCYLDIESYLEHSMRTEK